ncbi:MAG: cell division protein ZapA [Spirochaetia bacterium]|nr:cell division protein ZapA [Spirochaetia bacterium]
MTAGLSENKSELSKVSVDIMGDTYTIKGQANPGYIADVARIVDAKMRELSRSGSSHSKVKLAVITAVNLADELLQIKQDPSRIHSNGDDDGLSYRAEQLISLLDEGLIGDTFYAE